jgi:hypothetical protein
MRLPREWAEPATGDPRTHSYTLFGAKAMAVRYSHRTRSASTGDTLQDTATCEVPEDVQGRCCRRKDRKPVDSSPECPRSHLCAMFSYELLDGGLDDESIGRIHRGDFDEWISALARAGLFTNEGIRSIEQQWREEPRSLLDALLAAADEVTVKRCQDSWAEHDRAALGMPIEAV